MGIAVVVLLAGLWASILLPAAVRARRESSPIHTIDDFERSMGMLAPRTQPGTVATGQLPGRYVMVLERPGRVARPRPQSRVVERRKAVLQRLLAAVAVTALPALLGGGIFAALFTLAVLALGGYVGLLLQIRSRDLERATKLRRLPVGQAAPAQAPQRRRAVGGGEAFGL